MVTERDVVIVESITVGDQRGLVTEVDAYEWSCTHYEEVMQDCMRKSGCKTMEELYAYYERRDWALPNPQRAELPTAVKGVFFHMTGRYTGKVTGVPGDKRPGESFLFLLCFLGPGQIKRGVRE
jgi:hypothetical protein